MPDIDPPYRGLRARRQLEKQRRRVNVLSALMGLLLTLPLMLLIAAAVRASSPGPVIYRQDRVGMDRRSRRPSHSSNCRRRLNRGGAVFQIVKFRTMRVSDATTQNWPDADAHRVTRVGAFLRRHRLDELPQLVNVLKGDMNIVGPRPEQPEIFQSLKTQISNYPLRQRVLPGITGWAQINQAPDSSIDDVRSKIVLDLEYLRRRCVAEDIRIMARTLPVLLWARP
jgi:lipopolysaccharide/colanic/teichoic acid biosynthesis glycosyltransferase